MRIYCNESSQTRVQVHRYVVRHTMYNADRIRGRACVRVYMYRGRSDEEGACGATHLIKPKGRRAQQHSSTAAQQHSSTAAHVRPQSTSTGKHTYICISMCMCVEHLPAHAHKCTSVHSTLCTRTRMSYYHLCALCTNK